MGIECVTPEETDEFLKEIKRKDYIPREEVIDMLTHIEMLLLTMQDQEAWSYTHILLKAMKDGEY